MVALRLPRRLHPHRTALAALAESLWYVAQALNKPKTRADCVDGPRPCPWISCRAHMLGEVTGKGSYRVRADTPHVPWNSKTLNRKLPVVGQTLDEMVEVLTRLPHTCAEDVIDQADDADEGLRIKEIAWLMRLSAWRTRLANRSAQQKLGDELTRAERRKRMNERPISMGKEMSSATKKTNPKFTPYPHKQGTSKHARKANKAEGYTKSLNTVLDASRKRKAARKRGDK